MVLCTTAPQLLDCSWAAIGCGPLDLDGSGMVDAADAALFEARVVTVGDGASCTGTECDGADLDRSGTVDA